MFYFTCNESRIYESFTLWNKLQKKVLFHDIHFFRCTCIIIFFYFNIFKKKAEFKLHLSLVSHDPSVIVLICWFGTQETIIFY